MTQAIASYFAVAARGVEAAVAAELARRGAANIEAVNGGVRFDATARGLYDAALWLRCASRIVKPLREFAAANPEMLYAQARRVAWEQHFRPGATFAVDCRIAGGRSADLRHSHFTALKIKDAVAHRLLKETGHHFETDTANPGVRVHAYVASGRCTLSLDATGPGLHERGWRAAQGAAPLKETLAAAIVEYSGWDGTAAFVDPMCGSGTLVIEAAQRALNIAPGLTRERFDFFGWPDFDKAEWDTAVGAARAARRDSLPVKLYGFDAAAKMTRAAHENAERAGVAHVVEMATRTLDGLAAPAERGTLIVNPPYGERIGAASTLPALYKQLGDIFKQRFRGWTAWIFTGNPDLAKRVGLRTSQRLTLYNGPIECRLLKYELY